MGKKIAYVVICVFIFIYVTNLYASPSDEIQRRINTIQSKIDDGIKTGQLTEQESKSLQRRLDNIKTSFESAKKKNLPLSLVTNLNNRLDALYEDVVKERHDKQRKASASTERRIDHQIQEIQKRIDHGSKTGQLTDQEARYLQAKLNSIQNQYENVKKQTLTTQETKTIEKRLSELRTEITKQLYDKERKKK